MNRAARSAALAAAVSGAVLACSDATGPGPVEKIEGLPRQLSRVEEEVREASNAFAFDLSREIVPQAPDSNLFWSPLSASMALGMLLNGADGTTLDQMLSVLHFGGMTQEEINDGYRDLTDLLLGLDPAVTMEIGNSVWTRLGYPIESGFSQRVADAFGAESDEVDFADPATLDRVNGWARDATHGSIDPMFDSLSPDLVALLLNAVYFEGDWVTCFEEARTAPAPFTRPDGSTVTADLMKLDAEVRTGATAEATFVDLPYGGGAFSMTVVLPREGRTVADLVAGLDAGVWEGWIAGLHPAELEVHLPRFDLEWGAELNEPLEALGMTDAFDPSAADLSRLAPGDLVVSFVKQKAFVAVDERGTEAGAVTGIGVELTSAGPAFRADRPFLFVLRERFTGTVLFLGVVHDPTV
jgi:serpin B